MDTEYDFLTPEFLHLIFFKQKNIIIFPHVDLKHLRALEAFTIGYNLIDLEATALYNIREMIKSDAESYSQTPNYHLVYNLDKKRASRLLDLENAHVILNVNQNCSDLIDNAHENFIFYNKKSAKFLNYDFAGKDLKMEKMILSLAKTYEMIRDELHQIKHTANKIYTTLMNTPEDFDIYTLTSAYTLAEQDKIIEFTENYYDIILPEDENEQQNGKDKSSEPPRDHTSEAWDANPEKDLPRFTGTRGLDFSDEFEIIKNQNKHIFQIFLAELDEYRQQKVNSQHLELRQFFMPDNLYNYLRRHHWSEKIPEDFLTQWKDALTKNGGLSHNEILDFEVILRGLDVPNSTIDRIINGEKGKIAQKRKKGPQQTISHESIPSVSNFSEFKTWMLKRMKYIEKRIKKD